MRALIFFVSMILTLINLKAQNSTFRFKILDGSTGKRITQGIISYEDTLGNFEKFTVLDSSITQDIVPNKTLILTINSIDYHAYIEKMVFPY